MGIINANLQNDKKCSFDMAIKKLGLIIHAKILILTVSRQCKFSITKHEITDMCMIAIGSISVQMRTIENFC